MLKHGMRCCDVCGEEIPQDQKYCVHKIPAEAAALLLDTTDPALVPTWTQGSDGMVSLDICTTCYLSMGGAG